MKDNNRENAHQDTIYQRDAGSVGLSHAIAASALVDEAALLR